MEAVPSTSDGRQDQEMGARRHCLKDLFDSEDQIEQFEPVLSTISGKQDEENCKSSCLKYLLDAEEQREVINPVPFTNNSKQDEEISANPRLKDLLEVDLDLSRTTSGAEQGEEIESEVLKLKDVVKNSQLIKTVQYAGGGEHDEEIIAELPISKDAPDSEMQEVLIEKVRMCEINSEVVSLKDASGSEKESQLVKPVQSSGNREQDEEITPTPDLDVQKLLTENIRLCEELFDFRNSEEDTEELKKQKETKRKALLELVDYVTGCSEGFTKEFANELIKMVSINLFRKPTSHSREIKVYGFLCYGENTQHEYPAIKQLLYIETKGLEVFDLDDEEPYMDPAWVHLQIVYELLLRFLQSYSEEQFVGRFFIHNLLDLFQSEDPREREYLKMALSRIYDNFAVHQPFIRKAINDILYQIIYEGKKHSGISELLETYANIIDGFKEPLNEEQKFFFVHTLIPLHKLNDILVFHSPLCDCVTEFIRKDHSLAKIAVDGLLKYWPKTNSSKEVLFLGELGLILEDTPLEEFQTFMQPLFHKIHSCLCSTSSQVAEQALSLWKVDHVKHLIDQNYVVLLPIIFYSLEKSKVHRSTDVQELAKSVSNMFSDHDKEFYDKYREKYNYSQEDADKKYNVTASHAET